MSSFHGPKLVLRVSNLCIHTFKYKEHLTLKLKSFHQKMLRLRAGRSSVLLPAEARFCMHLCRPSLLFNKYAGIKRPGCECDHPSPATAQVNNECSYTFTFTPHIRDVSCLDRVTVTGTCCKLTFRHRASSILGQAFHYSPENAFYIFNQQIYFII